MLITNSQSFPQTEIWSTEAKSTQWLSSSRAMIQQFTLEYQLLKQVASLTSLIHALNHLLSRQDWLPTQLQTTSLELLSLFKWDYSWSSLRDAKSLTPALILDAKMVRPPCSTLTAVTSHSMVRLTVLPMTANSSLLQLKMTTHLVTSHQEPTSSRSLELLMDQQFLTQRRLLFWSRSQILVTHQD